MIHFLRAQEQSYLKLSKNVSEAHGVNSAFDFMTQDVGDDWQELDGREDLVMVDLSKEDSTQEIKGVLEKITRLTKMLASVNEVCLLDRRRTGRRHRPHRL